MKKFIEILPRIHRRSQLPVFFIPLLVLFISCAAHAQSTGSRCLVVDKATQELTVFMQGKRVASYPVTLGIDPVSDKRKAFDFATPEGIYFVSYKKAVTRFHRTLGISYPGLADAEKALAAGTISVPQYRKIRDAALKSRPGPCNTGLGCGIAIHGGGVFRQFGENLERDWTEGCIALDNPEMEKLFAFCQVGDAVVIFNSANNLYALARPFSRMTVLDTDGLPLCAQGICAYEARFTTSLGRMVVRITEGALWSVQATVHAADNAHEILLVLSDRNADGRMSFQDSANGSLAEGRSPEEVYAMVRQAVVDALASGSYREP